MHETVFYFPSQDGTSTIHVLLWEANTTASAAKTDGDKSNQTRGIIQLLHGMSECIDRYRDFAKFLTDHGFIVCGHDQIGHGRSVENTDELGIISPKGKRALVEDAHAVREYVLERYQASDGACNHRLPYFMFGHSMGSFVLRLYLTQYADCITGAILSGTGHPPALLSNLGLLLARLLYSAKGPEHRSKLLFGLTLGAYSKQIPNAQTPFDWLSTDSTVVYQYMEHESCGFEFGTGGYVTLTSMTSQIVRQNTISAVPIELPLLFLAGSEDPVGEKGVAVKRAVSLFESTGHEDVTLHLYEGMRHELLNEIEKERVYQDTLDWIEARL